MAESAKLALEAGHFRGSRVGRDGCVELLRMADEALQLPVKFIGESLRARPGSVGSRFCRFVGDGTKNIRVGLGSEWNAKAVIVGIKALIVDPGHEFAAI